MVNSQHRKKRNRKKLRILLGALTGIVIIGVILLITCFNISSVEVDGNIHYTDEEIKDIVLKGPFKTNSILISLSDMNKKTKEIPFLKSISVENSGRDKVTIHVTEKQMIGYIRFLDGYLYFDKNGVIIESSTEVAEDIPFVEGLSFDHVMLGEQLPVENDSVFNTIYSLSRMITKNQIWPDRIEFDEKNHIFFYYGQVRVNLGKDEYLEEKITHLTSILPEVTGMEGMLHLENVTTKAKTITFEKKSQEIIQPSDSASNSTVSGNQAKQTDNSDTEKQKGATQSENEGKQTKGTQSENADPQKGGTLSENKGNQPGRT